MDQIFPFILYRSNIYINIQYTHLRRFNISNLNLTFISVEAIFSAAQKVKSLRYSPQPLNWRSINSPEFRTWKHDFIRGVIAVFKLFCCRLPVSQPLEQRSSRPSGRRSWCSELKHPHDVCGWSPESSRVKIRAQTDSHQRVETWIWTGDNVSVVTAHSDTRARTRAATWKEDAGKRST